MPPVWPKIQLLGNGTPHIGSTWNLGGSASAGCNNAAASRPTKPSVRVIIARFLPCVLAMLSLQPSLSDLIPGFEGQVEGQVEGQHHLRGLRTLQPAV